MKKIDIIPSMDNHYTFDATQQKSEMQQKSNVAIPDFDKVLEAAIRRLDESKDDKSRG